MNGFGVHHGNGLLEKAGLLGGETGIEFIYWSVSSEFLEDKSLCLVEILDISIVFLQLEYFLSVPS
jgi:hypothetical protein